MLLWDALFVALAGLHGAVLLAAPSIPLIAVGVWWNSNTIAHNFIHRPFFRGPVPRALFSTYLSLLLGVPQTLWRERHLAHHAGVGWKLRWTPPLMVETALVLSLWTAIAFVHPHFFATAYLPGYGIGLVLCILQGYYEHAPAVTSHYGRLYNVLCFNDGFHAEHHACPGVHWTNLPARRSAEARISRWPAPLRWLDAFSLEGLERIVLRSPRLQKFVLNRHKRALAKLLLRLPEIHRVAIVGGGLFPRTAMILRELLPAARLTIVDSSAANLEVAKRVLGESVEYVHRRYRAGDSADADLLVIPLCFQGDRRELYRHTRGAMLIHDWIWRVRPASEVVSPLLLKRINLIP